MSATEPTVEKVPKAGQDDDEDEDIDQLIMDLQSHHGLDDDESEEEDDGASFKAVPEELLQTSPATGLTDDEVTKRRKKYGYNQMAE
ncbi:hypothetical protein OXX79_012151, partial [Metschnikowia pulcherrima]